MTKKLWIIIEHKEKDYRETGTRWIAFPAIDPENIKHTLDIVYDPDEDVGYRICEEKT
ncbi:MAG: hypothetical protein ABII20_06360 [Candidatus Omnitrophota bacterium]